MTPAVQEVIIYAIPFLLATIGYFVKGVLAEMKDIKSSLQLMLVKNESQETRINTNEKHIDALFKKNEELQRQVFELLKKQH